MGLLALILMMASQLLSVVVAMGLLALLLVMAMVMGFFRVFFLAVVMVNVN
jgi:hypothetical protein